MKVCIITIIGFSDYILFLGVMCTSLPAPDNGEIQYSPDTTAPFDYETIATYSCNDGFGPVGVTERLCGGDDPNAGEWSGNGATCDGKKNSANTVAQYLTRICICVTFMIGVRRYAFFSVHVHLDNCLYYFSPLCRCGMLVSGCNQQWTNRVQYGRESIRVWNDSQLLLQ